MARIALFENLPIGGKVWLGFSLTTALFMVVIWIYHATLFQSLSDYERLLSVSEARKSHLQHIYQYLLEARRSEKDFLAEKEMASAEDVDRRTKRILEEAAKLEWLEEDAGEKQVAARIRDLTEAYREAFSELVVDWQTKGLDHESGLQGRFRETIHLVEDKAHKFKASALYLTVLQIRRAEKDTGLRRDAEYVDRTHDLIQRFYRLVEESEMEDAVKRELTRTMEIYQEHFDTYAGGVLAGADVRGGKGAYRDDAHVLEEIIVSHFVPDLETDILMLRRWEKDYLLRGEPTYVDRVRQELGGIRDNIAASGISDQEKEALNEHLDRYERDFLSLVAQSDRIEVLQSQMQGVVEEIEDLIQSSVQSAVAEMTRLSAETTSYSAARARYALVIAFVALALAIFFAEFITRRITKPLRTLMALTEVFSDGRLAEQLDGNRDEVHALVRSMGVMNRTINGLFTDSGRTAGILEEISDELGYVLTRLRRFAAARGERDGRSEQAEATPRELSHALGDLKALSEKIEHLARSLRTRADDMAAQVRVQEEMLAEMMTRSK
jgi:methyl-accepting chemotaxis protein